MFGTVLAAPSVPQGCLGGPFGVLLRAARGAQKWPPYRRDWLFVWSLWGSLGCPVGSRPVLSLFFWALSLMNSRWAREVEPQAPVWVGCSKPSCFTRFWAGSGCGRLAGGRAWGALGASPGAPGSLWALWVPLGGGFWERLGASGLSGGFWGSLGGPPGPPSRTPKEALGGSWGPLGAFGRLWGLLGASGGLWGLLGASGSFSAALSRCSQDSPY